MEFLFRATCTLLVAALAFVAHAQSSTGEKSTLVRLEGGGAPVGLSLLLFGLDQKKALVWRSVDVKASDRTLSALLARANGWPNGSVSAATDALICDHNPHVCCPVSKAMGEGAQGRCKRELALHNVDSISAFVRESHKQCRTAIDEYLTNPEARTRICPSVWRFTSLPDGARTSAACDRSTASPWAVCLPTVRVSEQVGVQEVPFNPALDRSIQAKYEEMQGCSELASAERAECRASFSEAKLNAFNFGSYLERSRRDGTVSLPVRAYSVELPAVRPSPPVTGIKQSLDSASAAREVHDRRSLKIEWLDRERAGPVRPQQGSLAASAAVRSMQALKVMGYDEIAPTIQRSGVILAIDLVPLFKGNPRLPPAEVNSFTIHDVKGLRTSCPSASRLALKEWDWTTSDSPEHATEVVGLMAAKVVSSSQVFGVLARATGIRKVHAMFVDDGKGEPAYQTFVDKIFEIQPVASFVNAGCSNGTFPVVNVPLKFSSFGNAQMQSGYDGILFGRAADSHYALFVVAAGNPDDAAMARLKTAADCVHLPGCKASSTQNMVSVVGLDGSGLRPSPSSFHGTPFEVAAVGDVWTIGRKGEERRAVGSSYATPYVSSLASMIIGKANQLQPGGGLLQPVDVKTRILQTVDFLDDASVVEFGRINFSRGLEINHDILLLDTALAGAAAAKAPYCGNAKACVIGEVDKDDKLLVKGYDTTGYVEKEIQLERILRLQRGAGNKWNVLYVETGRDSMWVRRLRNAWFPAATELAFTPKGASPRKVPLSAVVDYTRCMWRKGNDGVCLRG